MSTIPTDGPTKVLLVPESIFSEVSSYAARLEQTRGEAAAKPPGDGGPTDDRTAHTDEINRFKNCPHR